MNLLLFQRNNGFLPFIVEQNIFQSLTYTMIENHVWLLLYPNTSGNLKDIQLFIDAVNIEKKDMEFINMGHEPIMVLDQNFNFEYVKSTLPPMGLIPVKDESFFKTTTPALLQN